MAIEKLDPSKKIKIVSTSDGAIDLEKSDVEAYQKNRDLKHIKFLEGQHPTYFIVKNIPSTEQVTIQQDHFKVDIPDIKPGSTPQIDMTSKMKVKQMNTGEMLIKYFKAGCQQYEENGQVHDCDPDVFPPQILQEIGAFIMLRSMIPPNKKKS